MVPIYNVCKASAVPRSVRSLGFCVFRGSLQCKVSVVLKSVCSIGFVGMVPIYIVSLGCPYTSEDLMLRVFIGFPITKSPFAPTAITLLF